MPHGGGPLAQQAVEQATRAGDIAPLFAAINDNVARIADALSGFGDRLARMETAHAAETRRLDDNQSRLARLMDTASERLQAISVEIATLRERVRGDERGDQESAGLRRQIDLRLWQVVILCASSAGAGGGAAALLKAALAALGAGR